VGLLPKGSVLQIPCRSQASDATHAAEVVCQSRQQIVHGAVVCGEQDKHSIVLRLGMYRGRHAEGY
jgi:hypothetical protein